MKIRSKTAFIQRVAVIAVAAISLVNFAPVRAFAFTCPNNDVCFFSGDNENGNHYQLTASDYLNSGDWNNIASGYRGSASNMSNYNLWTVNYQADDWTCFGANGAGSKGATGAAGYFYVNGNGGCQDCTPPLMSETCPAPSILTNAKYASLKDAVVIK